MKRRIAEIARFTKHPAAVAEFYAQLLDQLPADSGGEAFSFDIDGVSILVHPAEDGPPQPGWPDDVDHIAIAVENLDAECQRLNAAGYEITRPSDYPCGQQRVPVRPRRSHG